MSCGNASDPPICSVLSASLKCGTGVRLASARVRRRLFGFVGIRRGGKCRRCGARAPCPLAKERYLADSRNPRWHVRPQPDVFGPRVDRPVPSARCQWPASAGQAHSARQWSVAQSRCVGIVLIAPTVPVAERHGEAVIPTRESRRGRKCLLSSTGPKLDDFAALRPNPGG